MTGLFVLALIKARIITPGKAATYVLRWPLSSASSLIPPKETRVKCLPKDLAIDLATEVFPTPGGPCKQMIFPLEFPFLNLTARNYRILSLTSLRPV